MPEKVVIFGVVQKPRTPLLHNSNCSRFLLAYYKNKQKRIPVSMWVVLMPAGCEGFLRYSQNVFSSQMKAFLEMQNLHACNAVCSNCS